jgi:septal ring factor EnvC (AmiA/AmiB activator)
MGPHFRIIAIALLAAASGASAQQARLFEDPATIRRALGDAQAQGRVARLRAERYEAEAARTTELVAKTEQAAAGVAARIQQAEAQIAMQEANVRLIARQREVLRARLAERQQPLMQLTAALQRLSRRPPALSLLQPGSVHDAMHLRAVLETMLPEVNRRTAALRAEIDRSKALQRSAVLAANSLRASRSELAQRRQSLIALETRQRIASRTASGLADREAERSLAMAEKARDLDALALELGRAGELRQALARLPGPVMRPARPADARVMATEAPAPTITGPQGYVLPVAGRLVSGFGVSAPGVPVTRGVAVAPRAGAQAVAPAAGRVAFAGPYRGYGQIVIIEHAGGWTSLVTGLSRLDARVGDTLVTGAPLGIAGAGAPIVTLELRRDGEPVNPLQFVG